LRDALPEVFAAISDYGITRRAKENGLWSLALWNPRDFTTDNYRTVDDRPYGGGPGMVMAEPLARRSRRQAGSGTGEAKWSISRRRGR
jgi:tRNA (guanine37-N1)-methyltransferase